MKLCFYIRVLALFVGLVEGKISRDVKVMGYVVLGKGLSGSLLGVRTLVAYRFNRRLSDKALKVSRLARGGSFRSSVKGD